MTTLTKRRWPKEAEDIPVQQFITYRISRAHAKLNAQASHILGQKCGLSLSQWRIIAQLAIVGETTPKTISRRADIDKGLLSRKLRKLIDDGLVNTRPDPRDQRQQLISVSDAGREIFDNTLPTMRQRQAHLLNSLTEQEERVLFKALEKISAAAGRREF